MRFCTFIANSNRKERDGSIAWTFYQFLVKYVQQRSSQDLEYESLRKRHESKVEKI